MADSTSSGSSSSTSEPTFLETPENAIIDQLSAYARQLAGQMQQWANQTYAKTSAITDQAVGNFFQVSQRMGDMSRGLTDQYNNLFAPENAQLVAEANSYASPARMAVNMGQAGATQAQAGDHALKNSEEALRSYGINPSDGRYAALDKAAEVQNAANVAGAENMQRNSDIATGQRLRSEAVQVGAQLPAAIANINNTALQANTGASNAELANANTGRNLMSLPNDYLRTAMDIKLPPTGQRTLSNSSNNSHSSSPDGGGGSRGGNSGNNGGNNGGQDGSGGRAWMPEHGGQGGMQPAFGGRQPQGGPSVKNYPDGPDGPYQGPTGQPWDPNGSYDGGYNSGGWGGDPYTGGADEAGYNSGGWGGDPYAGSGDNYSDGGYSGGSDYNSGGWGGDPYAGTDYGSSGGYDYSNSAGGGYDTSSPGSDFYAGDYSSGGDYDMGGAYAQGGAIPPSASPSGGATTDDIPAQGPGGQPLRMNADEFVIPQDVARWKGQEFFQNLIDQSRKKRMGASAKPQPMRV